MFTPISYRDAVDRIAQLHRQADHHRLLRQAETRVLGRRRHRTRSAVSG